MRSLRQTSTSALFRWFWLTDGQETSTSSTRSSRCLLTRKSMDWARNWRLKSLLLLFLDMGKYSLMSLIFLDFSFSEASHKTGLNAATTARIFKKLMTDRLKFKKFYAQGGDWGTAIVSNIGRFFPNRHA